MLRININAADVRKKGKFQSERRTQALYGEPVEIIKRGQHYSQVRLYDGFRGYINNFFFSESNSETGTDYIVKATLTPAYTAPNSNAPVVTLLPFAAKIKAAPANDKFVLSHSHHYGQIYLKCSDLILASDAPILTKDRVPELIESAMRFMGVPYLWGGRTFFGVDCSGFVAIIYRYFGITLPRKSKWQSEIGKSVSQANIEPGDLIYFRKHVGIALNRYDYLDASLSKGGVHINTLDPTKKGFLKYREQTLRAIRRMTVD